MTLRNNTVAIYRQIIDYFEFEIASGRLPVGSRVDSIRELAVKFQVNPNTVQKALLELERDGYIVTDRTNGKFVTDDNEVIKALRVSLTDVITTDFLKNCQLLGITKKEAVESLMTYWRKENE